MHPDFPRSFSLGLPDLRYDPFLLLRAEKIFRMFFEKHFTHRRGRREMK
jgi:hypothetical protein